MFNFREKPKISNRLFRPNCFSPSRSRSDTPFFSFLPNNFFSNPPRKKLVKRVWVFRSLVFRRRVALGRRVGATAFVSVVTGFDGGSMTSRYGRPKTSTSWHRPRNPVCDVAKRSSSFETARLFVKQDILTSLPRFVAQESIKTLKDWLPCPQFKNDNCISPCLLIWDIWPKVTHS